MNLRYMKNLNSLTEAEQLRINQTTILVIGAGGLGGYVLDSLARLGVKKIKVVDFDTFDISNLNRQLLSKENNIGLFKANEAQKYIKSVNSSIKVEIFCKKFENCDFTSLFNEVDIVFDCCDNIESKFNIENKCQIFGIPLIHGAVGGFFGQVSYILPTSPILKKIYPNKSATGIETKLGNICFVVSIVASLQLSLFIRIISEQLHEYNGFYYIDIENFDIQWISFKI